MNDRPADDAALQQLRAANRLQRALLQVGMAQHLEGVIDPRERSAIVHSITRDLTWECNRCGGLFREAEIINDRGVFCTDCWRFESASRQRSTPSQVAGKDVPWESLERQYLLVQQLSPLAAIRGDLVAKPTFGSVFGIATVVVPGVDRSPEQRAVSVWLQDRDEYRALYRACILDAEVWDGAHEAIIMLSPRRAGLFGRTRRSLSIAIYVAGVWARYFEAIAGHDPPAFTWSEPIILFRAPGQPSAFPESRNTIGI